MNSARISAASWKWTLVFLGLASCLTFCIVQGADYAETTSGALIVAAARESQLAAEHFRFRCVSEVGR